MSKNIKKTILIFFRLVGVLIIGAIGGFWLNQKYFPTIVEKPVIVVEKEILEYDNPELIKEVIKKISQEKGINEKIFWAIIKCEGGHTFAWNKTWDGGLYQINWETAKRYGAQNLKDLIDPRLSTELAAKILEKEGLVPWRATRECIEKELIFTNLRVEK